MFPSASPLISVSPGVDTLQAAVDAASAGDILVLSDGSYTSSSGDQVVSIHNKDITIRSANTGQAVIDAQHTPGRRVIVADGRADAALVRLVNHRLIVRCKALGVARVDLAHRGLD